MKKRKVMDGKEESGMETGSGSKGRKKRK